VELEGLWNRLNNSFALHEVEELEKASIYAFKVLDIFFVTDGLDAIWIVFAHVTLQSLHSGS